MDATAPLADKANVQLGPFGSKLRARRRELGLTLVAVAEGSSLSPGFISQVERDLVSPSLSSLAAISHVLQMSVADILAMPNCGSISTSSHVRSSYSAGNGELSYERISTNFPGHVLNGVIMHSGPGRASEPIEHEGEELFYVLEGSITAIVDGEHTVLNEGDSMHFPSRRPHMTVNHTDKMASVLIICTMDVFGETDTFEPQELLRPRNPQYESHANEGESK